MYLISGYGNLKLVILLFSIYSTLGLSECAGPECLSDPSNYDKFDGEFITSTGAGLDGTTLRIE